MDSHSDEQLMLAYVAGDVTAFESLYARYRGPLYRFILRRVKDPATANDMYQGSWEKIIKSRRTYRQEVPFKAWMYRIARNHVVDYFRRAPPPADEDVVELADTAERPDQLLEQVEAAAALARAIAQLPDEQQEALLLKLEGGLDLHEIADVTGVSVETAKSRLRYALAKLRPLLQDPDKPAGNIHAQA
ncbi:MAG: sigma-70 family RNA polymerase sigma factor [Xanthomonadales bacterium]|nr:sigma-70 family RNA polymerase sigma factor [Xanthomonadales bacterium]